ncbi:MAG: glycoside hydrolase [Planctomycetia bacterium]|nr:glycoside hydrolase [Planctomycetia bacterium]
MINKNNFAKDIFSFWGQNLILFLVILSTNGLFGEEWQLDSQSPIWSRDQNSIAISEEPAEMFKNQPSTKIVHWGNQDWAVRLPQQIKVQPGDVFELSCSVKLEGNGSTETGVILYDGEKPIHWNYGGKGISSTNDQWTHLQSTFIVPQNVSKIEPRLIGYQPATIWFAHYQIKRTGRLEFITENQEFNLENDFLKLSFQTQDGSFSVFDKRTKRLWTQTNQTQNGFILSAQQLSKNQISFEMLDGQTMIRLKILLTLCDDKPELTVSLDGDPEAEMNAALFYPNSFASRKGDRIILPINEGISFPVEETSNPGPGVNWLYTYGGHGLCMAFWGQIEDQIGTTGGPGFLGIIETPDDAAVLLKDNPLNSRQISSDSSNASSQNETSQPLLVSAPIWEAQKGRFGYQRRLRFIFFDQGGHVALCKRYREYAKEIGLYVPFTEKIRKNPNLKQGIDLLIGAVNIWNWDANKIKLVQELQENGIERILWSANGTAEEIKALNEIPNVLTSRYDIYQDIMDPARFDEITEVHGDWVTEAWPQDINWQFPNGVWRKGWAIDSKDPTQPRVPCAVICDRQAIPYAEKRIEKDLETKPFRARFLDTTVASPWQECWHPDHPMTRSESKFWKMQLLALIGQRFNLVCGSETGHEASVPFCDFYEGMMSLGPYRVPESGRNMIERWDSVPELVEKYQVGEAFRLPLWELVYHDCTVSYWYWGDYNNKLPPIWKKRDLFNALYGVPPMYLFEYDFWNKNKDRFIESYRIAEPVSRATGYSEMTDHQILTSDRTVQKTVFANGVEVVVNFGLQPYQLPNGVVLKQNEVWNNLDQ